MFFRSTLLIAGAGFAVAQSLSSSCSSALVAIATSPDALCLDLILLAPLLTSNSSTTSIIPTVNTWVTGMCSQGPCTNATLQAVTANITNGCSSDLASFGVTNLNATTVEADYPAFRQIACLKDTSANSSCVTELLTDVQSATGTTLSFTNVVNLVMQITSGMSLNLPQNVRCSNCSKAAYTIDLQNFPTLQPNNQSALQAECGSSFTDGQIPASIQETASDSSSSSSSTGGTISFSVSTINIGLAMLIAVSSTFAILV